MLILAGPHILVFQLDQSWEERAHHRFDLLSAFQAWKVAEVHESVGFQELFHESDIKTVNAVEKLPGEGSLLRVGETGIATYLLGPFFSRKFIFLDHGSQSAVKSVIPFI